MTNDQYTNIMIEFERLHTRIDKLEEDSLSLSVLLDEQKFNKGFAEHQQGWHGRWASVIKNMNGDNELIYTTGFIGRPKSGS